VGKTRQYKIAELALPKTQNFSLLIAGPVPAHPLHSTLSLILFLHFILLEAPLKGLWYHHAVVFSIEVIATIMPRSNADSRKVYRKNGKIETYLEISVRYIYSLMHCVQ
jgi:hypothetical protein